MGLVTASLFRPDGQHWTTARDTNTEPWPWAINHLKTWVTACNLGESLKVLADHTTATTAVTTGSGNYMGFVLQAMSPEYGTTDPLSSKYGFRVIVGPTSSGYIYGYVQDGYDPSNTKSNGYISAPSSTLIESTINPWVAGATNITCLVAYDDTPGQRFFSYTTDKCPRFQFNISEVIPVPGALAVDKPSAANGYGWQLTLGDGISTTNLHAHYGQAFSCTRSLTSGTRWAIASENGVPYVPSPLYSTTLSGFLTKNLPVLSGQYSCYGTIPDSIVAINGGAVNWGTTFKHAGRTYTVLNYGVAVRTADS